MNLPLCVLLFLGLNAAVRSQKCGYGQVKKNGVCEDCPPGTYLRRIGPRSCAPCPLGTYNPLSRAPRIDVCRFCPEDMIATEPGATECTPCPPGTFSGSGNKCLVCGPGFSVNPFGGRKCVRCAKGTYSNGISNKSCSHCPFPLTGPRGSTSIKNCRKCPPGRSGAYCTKCIEGWVWVPEDGSCRRCPDGTASKPGAVECKPCPPGKFATFDEKNRKTGIIWFCKDCPEGTTSNRGSQTCRTPGASCSARNLTFASVTDSKDFFENKDGNCESCQLGYFMSETLKACVRCAPGSTSQGGRQNKCVECTGELVPDPANALCRCPTGRYYTKNGKCKDCPAGTGGNFINPELRGRNGCVECFQGTFASKPGSTYCTRCPFGSVANSQGSTSCEPCQKGTFPSFIQGSEANTCITLETGCPIGFRNKYFWGSNCRRIKDART